MEIKFCNHASLGMVVLLFSVSLGCKRIVEDPSSDLQTVGELSGGLDTLKSQEGCSGEFTKASLLKWAQGSETTPSTIGEAYDRQIRFEAHQDLAEKNLSAVPHVLMGRFLAYGYELHFVKDIATTCSNQKAPALSQVFENRAKLQTCVIEGFEKNSQTLRLVIEATPESINNNTVLAMIGVVGQRFDRVGHGRQGEFTLQANETTDSASLKRELAVTLLHEGLQSGVATFAILRPFLPKDPQFFDTATSKDQRGSIWDSHQSASPSATDVITQDIFNNVGDSFYCNQKTKSYLEDNFSATFALWRDSFDIDFRSQPQRGAPQALVAEDDSSAVTQATGSGLGLTSGEQASFLFWGYGHRPYWRGQPIRNVFRARNNQMANNYHQTGFRRPRLVGLRRPWNGSRSWSMPPRWGQGRLGWRLRR